MKRAYLLAQLVAAGFELFGLGDGFAAALIERAKIAQQRGRVGPRARSFSSTNSRLARTNPKSSMLYQFNREIGEPPFRLPLGGTRSARVPAMSVCQLLPARPRSLR